MKTGHITIKCRPQKDNGITTTLYKYIQQLECNGLISQKTLITTTHSILDTQKIPIYIKEIKFIIFKTFSKKEVPSLRGFTEKFYHIFKENLTSVIHDLFHKAQEEEHFPKHFVRLVLSSSMGLILSQYCTVLMTTSLSYGFKSGSVMFPDLFIFVKIALTTWGLLGSLQILGVFVLGL